MSATLIFGPIAIAVFGAGVWIGYPLHQRRAQVRADAMVKHLRSGWATPEPGQIRSHRRPPRGWNDTADDGNGIRYELQVLESVPRVGIRETRPATGRALRLVRTANRTTRLAPGLLPGTDRAGRRIRPVLRPRLGRAQRETSTVADCGIAAVGGVRGTVRPAKHASDIVAGSVGLSYPGRHAYGNVALVVGIEARAAYDAAVLTVQSVVDSVRRGRMWIEATS